MTSKRIVIPKRKREPGFFKKLFNPLSNYNLKREQRDWLCKLVRNAIRDGEVTSAELSSIHEFYRSSELSPEDYQSATIAAFRQEVQKAIADRRVTEKEESTLTRVAKKLRISSDIIEWMKDEIAIYSLLDIYSEPGPLPEDDVSIILKPGEIGYFEMPAMLLEERVIDSEYRGGSHGVSIRIMKGVSYRIGATKGRVHTERGIVPVSYGDFVITNKRLVFSGDQKSVAHNLSRLINTNLYADCFQYSITNRQKPIMIGFSSDGYSELCGIVLSRVLNGDV